MSEFYTVTDPSDHESFDPNGPSPNVVNRFHSNDDCDSSFYAHHHTIGNGPNQAASGKIVADLVRLVADLEDRIVALENP